MVNFHVSASRRIPRIENRRARTSRRRAVTPFCWNSSCTAKFNYRNAHSRSTGTAKCAFYPRSRDFFLETENGSPGAIKFITYRRARNPPSPSSANAASWESPAEKSVAASFRLFVSSILPPTFYVVWFYACARSVVSVRACVRLCVCDIARDIPRPLSFPPYGHPGVRSIDAPRGICHGKRNNACTPEKLQFPDVSDAPSAPLSQGRAHRIHNHARHEPRAQILAECNGLKPKLVTARGGHETKKFSRPQDDAARCIEKITDACNVSREMRPWGKRGKKVARFLYAEFIPILRLMQLRLDSWRGRLKSKVGLIPALKYSNNKLLSVPLKTRLFRPLQTLLDAAFSLSAFYSADTSHNGRHTCVPRVAK